MEKLSGLSGCQARLMGTIQFMQEEDPVGSNQECRWEEDCRGHEPGVTDWLDDPWPEMSRD
jgi:hypothetical protein